ncbi:MAG: hypothetical protein QM817_40890 [Archangium sp.]
MRCNDAFIGILKPLGYCMLRLPKADVSPLHLLAEQRGDLERLGDLRTVMVARAGVQVQPPAVTPNVQCANISGQRSSQLSSGVGVSVLGTVVSAMGGSQLGLDASFRAAHAMVFEFVDVVEDSIQVTQLDQYLTGSDVNPLSTAVERLLDADDIYVVTRVLKSKRISVMALESNGQGVATAVPEIQGIVGANVKVMHSSDKGTALSFEGMVPLVFGFQAVRLFYRDGKYTAFEAADPRLAMRGAAQATPKLLATPGPFVRAGRW